MACVINEVGERGQPHIQELIQMRGGATAILKDEYLIWIQTTHDIKY
jgi:hypothetical protein